MKMDRLQFTAGPQGGLQLMMDAKKTSSPTAPTFKSKRDQDARSKPLSRARTQPTTPGSRP